MRMLTGKTPSAKLLWLAVAALLLPAVHARANTGTVAARARTVVVSLQGFARVEPVALLRLKAGQTGTVAGLKVLPGEVLKAGAVLGYLEGPVAQAALARRRSAVAGAEAALTAARKILALERQKEASHLGTLKEVYQAETSQAEARARLDTARAQLRAAQEALTLRAPATGRVLNVEAAAGERMETGQTLLTLQPAGGLWLRADFFGTEAATVRVGMTGRFAPAAGGLVIPVAVRTVIGTTRPGGGLPVGLAATVPAPGWRIGEAGTVTLAGGRRTGVAVPTRALILDQGKWWVLVATSRGRRPQEVVPGASHGTWTVIAQGLEAGTKVVVENAYLEFHREFSRHYQAPD